MEEINKMLKDFLRKHNIKLLNPVWDSIQKKHVVGWYVQAPSPLRYDYSVMMVKKFIKENHLDYYLSGQDENIFDKRFIIYEKQSVKV